MIILYIWYEHFTFSPSNDNTFTIIGLDRLLKKNAKSCQFVKKGFWRKKKKYRRINYGLMTPFKKQLLRQIRSIAILVKMN